MELSHSTRNSNAMTNEVKGPSGNYYDKYSTSNPIARFLMNGFLRAFDELSSNIPIGSAFEIGCGEGELSLRLASLGWSVSGFDVDPAIVAEACKRAGERGISGEFFTASVYNFEPRTADLVVCCEVLEHVTDPQTALKNLSICGEYLLTSVPREPIWRALNIARGKYLSDWGNTPGHVQHWSTGAFIDLLKARYEIVSTRLPLPWTMALCRVRAWPHTD